MTIFYQSSGSLEPFGYHTRNFIVILAIKQMFSLEKSIFIHIWFVLFGFTLDITKQLCFYIQFY